MKKILVLIVIVCSVSLFFSSCKEKKHEEHSTEVHDEREHDTEMAVNTEFQCPMDCEKGKTYEKKGSCPVCKMDLKEAKKEEGHEEGEENHDKGKEESHEEGGENHAEEKGEHK